MPSFRPFLVLLLLSLSFQPTIAAEPDILKIAGWDVYGDPNHPNKTIGFRSFEEKSGAIIEFTPLSNLDDIITTAESGEHYDLYLISNEGIRILHDMGLVVPLNLDLLPNYQGLHHNLKYTEWGLFDSKVFATPWAWGPTGLMYERDTVKEPNSWNVLWDPALKGRVAMWDDISMIWTTALSLGYSNVYNLTRKQLEAVKQKLLAFNRQQAAHYYAGGGDEIELAKQGKIVAYNSWYDPSSRLKLAGKNFGMVIPKEGAVGMFDSYMISNDITHSKQSPGNRDSYPQHSHMTLAHDYINHQISPEIQREMVRITGLAPANIETLALLSSEEIKGLHLDEPDYFNRMLLWDHMPRKNLYQQILEVVREDRKRLAQ